MYIVVCLKRNERGKLEESHVSYRAERVARKLWVAACRIRNLNAFYKVRFDYQNIYVFKRLTFSPKLVAKGVYRFQPVELVESRNQRGSACFKTPQQFATRLLDAHEIQRLHYGVKHIIEAHERNRSGEDRPTLIL